MRCSEAVSSEGISADTQGTIFDQGLKLLYILDDIPNTPARVVVRPYVLFRLINSISMSRPPNPLPFHTLKNSYILLHTCYIWSNPGYSAPVGGLMLSTVYSIQSSYDILHSILRNSISALTGCAVLEDVRHQCHECWLVSPPAKILLGLLAPRHFS